MSTRGIANKDFRGMRRVVARFNFSCNLTGNRPQSLTGHTATVSRYAKEKPTPKFELKGKIHFMRRFVNSLVSFRCVYLIAFLFTIQTITFSQTKIFKGIITDEQTLKPIKDVNIRVYGTSKGTSTDRTGNFSLTFDKTPVELVFTCLGYETATFEVTRVSGKTIEFLLRPKSYMLQEVDISSKKYSFLFKDKDYSILDYELMDGKILLLIFRYQLKQSELVLLNRSGDTIAISPLPKLPPASLYKDFLSNVHYFSKTNDSYQCIYNEKNTRIEFFHKTTIDSLQSFVKPFIFKMEDRLYFQEKIASGYGTAFGFYEKGVGKKYIRKSVNVTKISESIDDQIFYQKWNNLVGKGNILALDDIESDQAFDFGQSRIEGSAFGKNEKRAHQFEFYKMVFPVMKTKEDNIAFFNFATDTIEQMDKNGKIIHTTPVRFHKGEVPKSDTVSSVKLSNAGWRWGSVILSDEYSHDIYTLFLSNGMVKVQRVDLRTGKLTNGTVLPFPFPEKIKIYNGDAYFLVKSDGINDKWKLVKCKI